jgi:type II secretory pathway pseudopilin PulG
MFASAPSKITLPRRPEKGSAHHSGFALLEVLIAGAVLAIAAIGLALLFSSAKSAAISQDDYRAATFLAEQKLEQIRANGFASVTPPGPASEDIYLCLDGTASIGTPCTPPGLGPKFTRSTCVRYVQDGNPDSPASTPPSCVSCTPGGSPCSGLSKRVEVTVSADRLEGASVTIDAIVTPSCLVGAPPVPC